MRYLTAALALAACASDPDSTQNTGTIDASVTQCPRRLSAGVVGADQFPDGRCLYHCSSAYRLCWPAGTTDGGAAQERLCTPYSDPQNCGDCGVRCVSGETCRVTSTSRGQYICTTSMLP